MDKIFPSLEEISFCIRKNLVNSNEAILYKMILDHHEAVLSHKAKENSLSSTEVSEFHDKLIPSQYYFYKNLKQKELDSLLESMRYLQNCVVCPLSSQNEQEDPLQTHNSC